MTSTDSTLVTKPTAIFWTALELYAEGSLRRRTFFEQCIPKEHATHEQHLFRVNSKEGEMGGTLLVFFEKNQKRYDNGLKLTQILFAHKQEVNTWLYESGQKHGVNRQQQTIADLDWLCLLWRFAPEMISEKIPDKDLLEEALHATLDQIGLGRLLTNRSRSLSGNPACHHVEVDVTVFCGIAEDGSTLDEGAQFTRALNLYCFVQY